MSMPALAVAKVARQIAIENPQPPPANEAQFLIDKAVARLVEEWKGQQTLLDGTTFKAQWMSLSPAQRANIRATLGLANGEDPA